MAKIYRISPIGLTLIVLLSVLSPTKSFNFFIQRGSGGAGGWSSSGNHGQDGQDGQSVVVSNSDRCLCQSPSFTNNFQMVWGTYVTLNGLRSCQCSPQVNIPSNEPATVTDQDTRQNISNPLPASNGFFNFFGNDFTPPQPQVCACLTGGSSQCCCQNTCGMRCGWYFRCGQGCGC